MTEKLPTNKQLETKICQSIRDLYKNKIEFISSKISCKLFAKHLIIVIEEGLSLVERNLWKTGKTELSTELSIQLNSIIKLEVVKIIQEILQVDVIEIMSGSTHQTNRLGIMVVLSQSPSIKEFRPVSKTKD